MKDLAELQLVLADLVRRPEPIADVDLARRIATGNERLAPIEQLEIYREQFFFRHVDVLRDDFKALERLLGKDAFTALARAYLAAVPPSSFTLRDLGRGMVTFSKTVAPWSEDPLLAEIAMVEWAFVEAFDGPDASPFDPASVAGIPEEEWPNARLVLDPSLQRLALGHPAHDYRIDARKDGPAPPRPAPRPCYVVIGRGPTALTAWDVEREAYALLDELASGVALGDACERAASASGIALAAFQQKIAAWFSEWTARGWIRRVKFTSCPSA